MHKRLDKIKKIMPVKAGIRSFIKNLAKWVIDQTPAFAGVTALLMIFAVSAHAEEFTYSPEGCDFQITFPDEPYATRRCHDQMRDKCTLMTSYTQVIDLDTTINFYVTCKQSKESLRDSFTPDLMRTSILARPGVQNLEVYDISYDETDNATMAALLGAGKSANGNDTMLSVIQLWIGDKSVLSLEGELIGQQTEKSDRIFADILQSLHHNDWQPPETESQESPSPEKNGEQK